jgi:aromatic ring-cleaving dioxygenase
MKMHGKVTEWQMTEEERLAYIEKHPIKNKQKNDDKKDFKWRGKKASESRWR